MTSHYDDVIGHVSRLRHVLDDKYAHAHHDVGSLARLAARLPAAGVRLALSERTGSDVTRSLMTSLGEAADELGRGSVDARAAWRETKATVGDIWRTMIGDDDDDDPLRNFYLNVYNDVSDVSSRAGRPSRLTSFHPSGSKCDPVRRGCDQSARPTSFRHPL